MCEEELCACNQVDGPVDCQVCGSNFDLCQDVCWECENKELEAFYENQKD